MCIHVVTCMYIYIYMYMHDRNVCERIDKVSFYLQQYYYLCLHPHLHLNISMPMFLRIMLANLCLFCIYTSPTEYCIYIYTYLRSQTCTHSEQHLHIHLHQDPCLYIHTHVYFRQAMLTEVSHPCSNIMANQCCPSTQHGQRSARGISCNPHRCTS